MTRRAPRRRPRGDDGVASLLAVGLAAVLLLAFVAAVGVAQLALVRQRAALLADTAALAGAGRLLAGADDAAACRRAADLAARESGRVTACRVDGLDVEVEVAVTLPPWLAAAGRRSGAGDGAVRVRARAGPPGEASTGP